MFKAHICSQKRDQLKVDFPEALKIEEARIFPRVKFGLRSYQFIEVIIPVNKDLKINVRCPLMDYSYGGIGFLIDKRYIKYLANDALLNVGDATIKDLSNRKLRVRSCSMFENVLSGNNYIRVGSEYED